MMSHLRGKLALRNVNLVVHGKFQQTKESKIEDLFQKFSQLPFFVDSHPSSPIKFKPHNSQLRVTLHRTGIVVISGSSDMKSIEEGVRAFKQSTKELVDTEIDIVDLRILYRTMIGKEDISNKMVDFSELRTCLITTCNAKECTVNVGLKMKFPDHIYACVYENGHFLFVVRAITKEESINKTQQLLRVLIQRFAVTRKQQVEDKFRHMSIN
jgi:hypothetical protein